MRKLLFTLFGPTSKFNIGDTVQPIHSDQLMVVIEIIKERDLEVPIVQCQWYDAKSKSDRKDLFSEKDLIPFDWYHT